MKRLKLFENFHWKTEDYYIKSTEEEYHRSKMESFQKMYLSMIRKWGFEFETQEFGRSRFDSGILHFNRSKKIYVESTDNSIAIYEAFDYYFWVLMEDGEDLSYYRCDQIDGVERLLQDKNIIRK